MPLKRSTEEYSNIADLKPHIPPLKVMLCSAEYFDIIDVKNIYMTGMAGKVNRDLAIKQWENLKQVYLEMKNESIIEEVSVIPGKPGLEDMVFCANQTFPWKDGVGNLKVILSNMKHPSRQREVESFRNFYIEKGYEIIELESQLTFEGMGDAIAHPAKNLIFGGYGFRSENNAYGKISEILKVSVVLLELVNENYYHLDTCFIPLDEDTALIAPAAFSEDSIAILKKVFSNLIEVPEAEALNFALNAHCIINPNNGKRAALIQKGNDSTTSILKKVGFQVWEVDTSEFMKSGGSVFCMKMMYY